MRHGSVPVTTALCVLIVAIVPGQASNAAARGQARALQENERLLRNQTLHEGAVANGGKIVTSVPAHTRGVATGIEMLGQGSDLVLVGTVISAAARLTGDGKSIMTYCDLEVTQVFKGSSRTLATVRIPGGSVTFSDGTTAEVTAEGFRLEQGHRYVLFLQLVRVGEGSDKNAYSPLLGTQSVFDITSDTTGVKSMARPTDPVRTKYGGRDVNSFLQTVETEAATIQRR